jgi:phosphate:Na+ symporter
MQSDLTSEEAKQIPLLLHCTNDAERIGDLSENIKAIMDTMIRNKYSFSQKAEEEFNELHEKLTMLAESAISLFYKKSDELLGKAKHLKREVADMINIVEADHISRVNTGSCLPEVSVLYLELLESIRKVAKNLNNIVDRAEMFYEKLPKVKRPNVENKQA